MPIPRRQTNTIGEDYSWTGATFNAGWFRFTAEDGPSKELVEAGEMFDKEKAADIDGAEGAVAKCSQTIWYSAADKLKS